MSEEPSSEEGHSLRGATDRAALIRIRDIIAEIEPFATPRLDDYLHPSVLEVTLADSIGKADSARIDIVWTIQGDHKFHYTDSEDVDLRWGKHPHDGDYIHVPGLEHYHPPPEASSDPDAVAASCIEQTPEELVTRAVFKLWRVGYHVDSYEPLNEGQNPP